MVVSFLYKLMINYFLSPLLHHCFLNSTLSLWWLQWIVSEQITSCRWRTVSLRWNSIRGHSAWGTTTWRHTAWRNTLAWGHSLTWRTVTWWHSLVGWNSLTWWHSLAWRTLAWRHSLTWGTLRSLTKNAVIIEYLTYPPGP